MHGKNVLLPGTSFFKAGIIHLGYRQRVIDTFNWFIMNKNDIFKDQKLVNGDYFWQHIRQSIRYVVHKANFFAFCITLLAAKQCCERTISMQKLVLTARRMCSKKELLDARISLLLWLKLSQEHQIKKIALPIH